VDVDLSVVVLPWGEKARTGEHCAGTHSGNGGGCAGVVTVTVVVTMMVVVMVMVVVCE